jgi:hypothetical protein
MVMAIAQRYYCQAVASTVSAGGIAGWLGFTTTVTTVVASPITLPVGGVIAVGAL